MTSGYYRKVTALQKKTSQVYSHMLHAWNIGQQLTPKVPGYLCSQLSMDILIYIYTYITLYTSHHITSPHITSHHITYISIYTIVPSYSSDTD